MSITETIISPVAAAAPVINSALAHSTVLLVEDDRAMRRYLEVILQRAGYTVITAVDGLEAMKAALSSAVDLVVTDAIMPHLNGYDLSRFLRRHPKLAHLPIVLMSGIDQADATSEAGAPADIRLTKPVRAEDLVKCLAGLSASRRA